EGAFLPGCLPPPQGAHVSDALVHAPPHPTSGGDRLEARSTLLPISRRTYERGPDGSDRTLENAAEGTTGRRGKMSPGRGILLALLLVSVSDVASAQLFSYDREAPRP